MAVGLFAVSTPRIPAPRAWSGGRESMVGTLPRLLLRNRATGLDPDFGHTR